MVKIILTKLVWQTLPFNKPIKKQQQNANANANVVVDLTQYNTPTTGQWKTTFGQQLLKMPESATCQGIK